MQQQIISPFTIDSNKVFTDQLAPAKKEDLGFNFGIFSEPVSLASSGQSQPMNVVVEKKKRTKKKKNQTQNKTKKLGNGVEFVPVESERELSQMETNTPYMNTYDETCNLLKGTIAQIDNITAQVSQELEMVRSSKTLKNKYQYIPNLASTVSALIGSKVSAIREINSSITNSHNLDLKRTKELKLNEVGKDDDKAIMDLYNMFITNPTAGTSPMQGMSMYQSPGVGGINRVGLGGEGGLNYSPGTEKQFAAMQMEHDPNIKLVIKYNQDNGARWFDKVNVQTGASIPNADLLDPMFLEDFTLDINTGIATNTNLDMTCPIIMVGQGLQNY